MTKHKNAVKAGHRERMIEVKVRFFTNGIDERSGYILPKNALTSGAVQMDRNISHGIEPESSLIFHSLMELPSKIEQLLIKQGITLHTVSRMEKYIK